MGSPYKVKFLSLGSNLPNRVTIVGTATIGATGSVAAVSPSGLALSQALPANGSPVPSSLHTITRVSAGVYHVTCDEDYFKFAGCLAEYMSNVALNSPDTLELRLPAFDVANRRQVINVVTRAGGVATDPPVGAQISYALEFINSASPRS